jgi:hypothetical protein
MIGFAQITSLLSVGRVTSTHMRFVMTNCPIEHNKRNFAFWKNSSFTRALAKTSITGLMVAFGALILDNPPAEAAAFPGLAKASQSVFGTIPGVGAIATQIPDAVGLLFFLVGLLALITSFFQSRNEQEYRGALITGVSSFVLLFFAITLDKVIFA